MYSARLFFGVLIVIVISTTYIFVRSPAFGSRFEVTNSSAQDITVTAKWHDQSREIGTILASSKLAFTLREKAAMVLLVHYADGREIESVPIAFTPEKPTIIVISNQSIDVQAKVGTQPD